MLVVVDVVVYVTGVDNIITTHFKVSDTSVSLRSRKHGHSGRVGTWTASSAAHQESRWISR